MNTLSVTHKMSYRPQAGLTLVEVLIALALSGLLISGAIRVVQGNKATLTLMDSFVQAQETGRFSLEVLSRDIRMAGYGGCVNASTKITSMLDETDSEYNAEKYSFSSAITAIDSYDPVVDSVAFGGVTPTLGSDVLIMRGAVPTDLLVSKTPSASAANIHVYGPQKQMELVSKAVSSVSEGMVLLVTDCSVGHIFSVSNTTGGSGGGSLSVVHNIAVTGGADNTDNSLDYSYASGSSVLMMSNVAYFIAPSTVADHTHSLFRYSTFEGAGAVELIPFIDDLIFTYGVDIDGDHYVDRYVTGDELNSLAYSMAYDAAYAEVYSNQIAMGSSESDSVAAAELAAEAAGNAAAAASTVSDFVVSIRVEIVTQGVNDVGAAQLTGFDDDGKLRKRFTRVIHVRNAGIGNNG